MENQGLGVSTSATVVFTPTVQEPQWAIVELMGHVKIAGIVSEVTQFGATLGRVDVPQGDEFVTQYFSGAAVYRITFVSEDAARAIAARYSPEPIHRWEMPALREAETVNDADDPFDDGYIPAGEENDDAIYAAGGCEEGDSDPVIG